MYICVKNYVKNWTVFLGATRVDTHTHEWLKDRFS